MTYELSEEEAVTVARALNCYNTFLLSEYEKIADGNGAEVSLFIVEAARNQYNELSEAGTKLHVALADAFPRLRQR